MELLGTLVRWREEDGRVAIGSISKVEPPTYNANLNMELTYVTIEWSDGNEPTRHTLESLRTDSRVEIAA